MDDTRVKSIDPLELSPEARSMLFNSITQTKYINSLKDSDIETFSEMEHNLCFEPETQPQGDLRQQMNSENQDSEFLEIGFNIVGDKNFAFINCIYLH